MNKGYVKIWLAAALAAGFTLVWGIGLLFGGEYATLAAQLAAAARERGFTRMAVMDFTTGPGATPEEAAAAQLRLSEELFRLNEAGVMDAAMLDRLGERGRRWPQVLLKGGLFGSQEGPVLVIKLLSPRSGAVLGALQVRVNTPPHIPADLRDAPGEEAAPCARAAAELSRAGELALDARARYWAERLRSPGYAPRSEEALPGSDLKNYGARQKFYLLLNEYYAGEAPVTLTAGEREELEELRKKEAAYARDCAR